MIAFPAGVKVWIAGGVTDMRCGMNSLALKVQEGLGRDPHGGEVFCFRGRRGDLVKILCHDGVSMSLYATRLEAGKFMAKRSSVQTFSLSLSCDGGSVAQLAGAKSRGMCYISPRSEAGVRGRTTEADVL